MEFDGSKVVVDWFPFTLLNKESEKEKEQKKRVALSKTKPIVSDFKIRIMSCHLLIKLSLTCMHPSDYKRNPVFKPGKLRVRHFLFKLI